MTSRLLDLLAEKRVKGTFFMVGNRVARQPALARRASREGHVIANHTWGHPQLTRLSDRAIRWQLRATRDRLRRPVPIRVR